MNKADTRFWTTLPKEFSYVRMKTPVNRKLIIRVGYEEKTINLEQDGINVIYVRSINNLLPFTYKQFSF